MNVEQNYDLESLKKKVEKQVKENKIIIYMKGTADFPRCGFSSQAVNVLKTLNMPFMSVDVLSDDPLWTALEEYTQWPTVPQIFINGEFIGGCDIITEIYERGELEALAAGKK
ncbi:MAG: Grx4 family monothiol glutaredoxin [Oligoflexia bacterium]|nr:Grx4 family monothiol glutaredoxin [Oligoflexia bacterium]